MTENKEQLFEALNHSIKLIETLFDCYDDLLTLSYQRLDKENRSLIAELEKYKKGEM